MASGPQAWEGVKRRGQSAVVIMLTGERAGALRASGGSVEPGLGTVVEQVRQRRVDQGFEKAVAIPDGDRTVTLSRTVQTVTSTAVERSLS
ncbi:hypothetical protein [Streptomyces sp. NPDC050263]|uniref:hypothetical protein n=1 Tax=Streptomyces sp. NPDC050263 TaxID=3155037 RepID=UPI0034396B26